MKQLLICLLLTISVACNLNSRFTGFTIYTNDFNDRVSVDIERRKDTLRHWDLEHEEFVKLMQYIGKDHNVRIKPRKR